MNLDKYSFTTQHGKLLSTELFPNGNMLRTTSELLFLMGDKLDKTLQEEYYLGIEDCNTKDNETCIFTESYIYSRYPDKLENTSVDDYLVLGTSTLRSKFILNSIDNHFGFLDVNYPDVSFKQWMIRFQGMYQHLKISCNEPLSLFGQLMWSISIVLAAKQPLTNQDNWVLSHIMILTKEKREYNSWITDLAVKYWKSKKGNVKTSELVKQYLGSNCQDHPLIEAWSLYD